MPKLSEVIAGDKKALKLSDVIAGRGYSNKDLPTIAGPLGFSDEFRDATGAGNLGAIRPALADMFGNYQDVARSLQKVAPGAKVVKDRDGIETLELPDGRRFRMNNKGVDINEVAAGVARVGAFGPVARGVNAVGAVARAIPGVGRLMPAAGGLSSRVAGGVATGVAGDVAQQAMAGRGVTDEGQDIDGGQAALSGAFGGAGEFVAPVAGAIRNALTPKASQEIAVQTAKELGLTGLTVKQMETLRALAPQIKAGMPKEAVLAQLVTGAPIMRGQLPGRFDDASTLERLKNTAGEDPAGQVVRGVLDSQFQGMNRARDDLLGQISGQGPVTATDAVTRARDALTGRAGQMQEGIDKAYGALAGRSASIGGDFAETLPSFIGQKLKEAAVPESSILAQASTFAKSQVDNFVRNPGGKSIETLRRELNEIYKTAGNDADRRGVTIIKKSLDSWVDDALVKGVVQGDASVIEALKGARDLRAQFGRAFEAKDAADKGGKWIEAALEGKSVDELTTAVFGAGQVSPKASVQIAQRLKSTLGDDKAAWASFRSAYLTRLTSGKDGQMLGYQAIQGNIRQFLREQPDLVKTILTGPEKTALNNLANAAEFLMPKGDMARSSGTAERAMRMLSSAMNNAPIVGQLMQTIAKPRDLGKAMQQTSLPYRPAPTVSPFAAPLGGVTQNYLQGNTQRPRPIR